MKRVCKNVKIDDPQLILRAVYECFRTAKKRKRADTCVLFARVLGFSKSATKRALLSKDENYHEGVRRIAAMLRDSIIKRQLNLTKIRQEVRQDLSSRKLRLISILGIRQLAFDHIAVLALEELSARIGEY